MRRVVPCVRAAVRRFGEHRAVPLLALLLPGAKTSPALAPHSTRRSGPDLEHRRLV